MQIQPIIKFLKNVCIFHLFLVLFWCIWTWLDPSVSQPVCIPIPFSPGVICVLLNDRVKERIKKEKERNRKNDIMIFNIQNILVKKQIYIQILLKLLTPSDVMVKINLQTSGHLVIKLYSVLGVQDLCSKHQIQCFDWMNSETGYSKNFPNLMTPRPD